MLPPAEAGQKTGAVLEGPLARPFYGVILAPTLVLASYGGTHVSPDHLYRPLGVLALAAAIAFGLIGGLSGRWHLASLSVALALLAVIGLMPLFLALAAGWLFVTWRSMRRRQTWDAAPQLTRALNVLVAAWCVVALVTAVAVSLPGQLPPPRTVAIEPGPNLYLIMLDGYPRHDSLMEYFGFDNRPFLDALEDRGFQVAENAGSAYPATNQVVPTMLHMRPIEELLDTDWEESNAQLRFMWHLLNAAPVPQAYQSAGYTTYAIVSNAPALDWRTADIVLDNRWLSEFELNLVEHGILRTILPLDAMHRASILDGFAALERSAGTSPRFVFAHIMSPHSPYVFAANGSPAEPCGSECTNHAGPPNPTLADRLIGQLVFLNGRVLDAVDRIIEADPEATLVVFSDHGLRRDTADMDEWLRTLFAARGASFPDDITPLELFPALLSQSR